MNRKPTWMVAIFSLVGSLKWHTSAPLIGFWVPKWATQAERFEGGYHFIRRWPTGFDAQPIRVPMNSQLPKLLQINERASRNVVRRAPLIDGLFRPEEEHGSSRKNEIVPPMRRRHSEMCDVRFQDRLTVFHFEHQRFASVSIRSAADRIAMQRRCDSVGVPNAIRVIAPAIRFNRKPGWDARKWWRHSDSMRIAGFRKEKTFGMQVLESGEHF